MNPFPRYDAVPESSGEDSTDGYEDTGPYELEDFEEHVPFAQLAPTARPRWLHRHGHSTLLQSPPWRPRSTFHLLARAIQAGALLTFVLLVIAGVFFPSYTAPPQRYEILRWRVEQGLGFANPNNETVFLAASLYDNRGHLVAGDWGNAVLRLVEILGPDNVFVSIYENNADEDAVEALDEFRDKLPCEAATTTEKLDLSRMPHVALPGGTPRLKRVSYLADVRNRALRPLDDPSSPASSRHFDKLLYVNDVIFDPVDAANLLFSTDMDETTGRTRYRAACAMDFIDPVKYYDTFATRDLEGYDMGIPFYPWFSSGGAAASRSDVLAQKDAVRVRSCWGGMVAFEARWFQRSREKGSPEPLRFRAEDSPLWEASECCLIHADLSAQAPGSLSANDSGIVMNPYIRVAYSRSVFRWLSLARRFERLYTPVQTILNALVGQPSYNPRQFESAGDTISSREWVWDEPSQAALDAGDVQTDVALHGEYRNVTRTALPGGFCGARRLFYIKEHPPPKEGERNWKEEKLPIIS